MVTPAIRTRRSQSGNLIDVMSIVVSPLSPLARIFVRHPRATETSGLGRTSGVVIKLAQRNPDLAGKIDQRDRECAKGNHEQEGNPALVPNLEKRACESHNH